MIGLYKYHTAVGVSIQAARHSGCTIQAARHLTTSHDIRAARVTRLHACHPSVSHPSAAFEHDASPVGRPASEGHARLVSSPRRFSSSSCSYGKAILGCAARLWPDWSKNASTWSCVPKPSNGVYGAIKKGRSGLDERQRARIATLVRDFPRTPTDSPTNSADEPKMSGASPGKPLLRSSLPEYSTSPIGATSP